MHDDDDWGVLILLDLLADLLTELVPGWALFVVVVIGLVVWYCW